VVPMVRTALMAACTALSITGTIQLEILSVFEALPILT